jgi:hypothetical protein
MVSEAEADLSTAIANGTFPSSASDFLTWISKSIDPARSVGATPMQWTTVFVNGRPVDVTAITYRDRANLRLRLGKWKDAESDYSAAITRGLENAATYAQRGDIRLRL